MTIWSQPDFSGRIEDAWYSLDAGEGGEAAELILAAMKLGGVDHLWFVSGSELTMFQEAAAKANALGRPTPRIMTMIHEHAALCAAIGESMVTGKPAAACAHVELGLLNMGGAIHIAAKGGYPVMLLTGVPSASYPDSGPGSRSHTVFWRQQIRDQGEIVRQYMKWDWKLAPYDNAGLTVTRALQVALSEPAGPVYLAVPREAGQTPIQGVQRFPTLDYLTPAGPPAPDPDLIKRAAAILIEAATPAIVVEKLGRDQTAVGPLQTLAELLGARVSSLAARYNFPQPHPLRNAPGQRMSPNLTGADVLLAIDAKLPWLPGETGPRAGTKVIWIDIDPIAQDVPIWEFPADIRMTASSRLAIPALIAEIERQLTADDRRRLDVRRERLYAEGRAAIERDQAATQADGKLAQITPRWAGYQLAQAIDDETIVFGEGGYTGALRRTRPGTVFFHGAASLGFSLAAIVGAKTQLPDRRFVTLMGDGAYNFALASQCFWAARQYKTPFVTLIFNNRGYHTGTTSVVDAYPNGYAARSGDFSGGFFDPPPDYVAEAQAAGCFAAKVTTPDEVGPAIERAIRACDREGVPAVVDVWLPKHVTGEV